MEEGEDQADLLTIAAGELSEGSIQIGPKALGKGLRPPEGVDAPQASEQGNCLAPGSELAVAEVARQVAEPGVNRDAVAMAVEAEDAGTAPRRMEKIQSVRIVVVFPAPLGPRKPNISPGSTAIVTSSMPRWLP